MNQLIHKLFSKYPTTLPIIVIIFQELELWDLIEIGNHFNYFLIFVVVLTTAIMFFGDYVKRVWRAPLIGLLTWEMLRIALIDFRHVYPYLLIALLILTVGSIILKVNLKIPIPKRVWGGSILFIVVLFGLVFDYSDSIRGNLFDLSDEIQRWVVVSIPFIIFDLIQNKRQDWPQYLVYYAWLPSAMLAYPIARLGYSEVQNYEVLNAGFWILSTLVFFVLIPLIYGKGGKWEKTERILLSISAATIIIVSVTKWVFLENQDILVSPAWILVIKSWLLLWFPLLILRLFYKDDLEGKN